MANWRAIIQRHFPGALPQDQFLTRSSLALERLGFHREPTLAIANLCRDELVTPFLTGIQAAWGQAFLSSSLAGMLFMGRTGLLAAQHHAPTTKDGHWIVFFVLPHIGVGPRGEIGVCRRPGIREPSAACGALKAFRQEMASGRVRLELDRLDLEQSLLKQRLFRRIPYGQVPDLVALTKIAQEGLLYDVEELLRATEGDAARHYAVLNGIQVHAPDGADMIWPACLYTVVRGKRRTLRV